MSIHLTGQFGLLRARSVNASSIYVPSRSLLVISLRAEEAVSSLEPALLFLERRSAANSARVLNAM